MPQRADSLWNRVVAGDRLAARFLWAADHSVALSELASGSSLAAGPGEFAGRSVLVATKDQLAAALALIELDGIACRLVLCSPDVAVEHIPEIIAIAEIDVVVTDGTIPGTGLPDHVRLVRCNSAIVPADLTRSAQCESEWVLLTSGTTGLPKLVAHTLSSLAGGIVPNDVTPTMRAVWSTFYDIRRYGGLQIFLRAVLGGASLVLSSPSEAVADFLARAGGHGITHISGTPSHWRRALMSPAASQIAPKYVRLSGEIADQSILDDLSVFYHDANVAHAFATTEAGVGFTVDDGVAGFPASLIGQPGATVEMKIEDGSLHIRSGRTASRYLAGARPLRNDDGFVDTGDMLERRGDRYYFVGRRGGIINVGGLKVHPEEVEAVINRHPAVRMSLVKPRKNPFTGAVVVADVVVRSDATGDPKLTSNIIGHCRGTLAAHKVPAMIRIVPSLNVGAAGKLARLGASTDGA